MADVIRRARRKPDALKVVQFLPGKADIPHGVYQRGPSDGSQTYYCKNLVHGTELPVVPGDWIDITLANDVHPIPAAEFRAAYELLD